jgi:8-oxo-dGTP diphosphatase
MPREEQGVSKDRYMIIPRTLIFIRCGESFLLIKGATHKRLWANKYNGVGGHVERGEDILAAAQRELLEETGLSVEISLYGVVTVNPGEDVGIGIFVFSGEYTHGEIKSSREGNLEWVKIKDLDSRPLVEDVLLFLNRIIKMNAGDLPFFAHSSYDSENKLVINFRD